MTRYSAQRLDSLPGFQGGDGELSVEEQSINLTPTSRCSARKWQHSLKGDQKSLKAFEAKWSFIKGSLVNFTENNVPFVVNLYSLKMVTLLDELEGMR